MLDVLLAWRAPSAPALERAVSSATMAAIGPKPKCRHVRDLVAIGGKRT